MKQEWIDHDNRVKPYHFTHRKIGWASKVIGLLFLAFLLFTKALPQLHEFCIGLTSHNFFSWCVFFGILGGLYKVISIPFEIFSQQVEIKYELSKQTWGSWWSDQLKGLLLLMVFGAITLFIFYMSFHFSYEWGWLLSATFVFLFSVLLAQLAPVLLIPIFYPLKPLEDKELKDSLIELAKQKGVHVADVFHIGLGTKTEKGNAAFTGLGKTKKILIGDTFYERFPKQEVKAVFGHELGHQVHNDIWKGLLLGTFFIFVSFGLGYFCFEPITQLLPSLQSTSLLHSPGMFLFFVLVSIIKIPMDVAQAWFSRCREYAADDYAAKELNFSSELASALEKLTVQNYGLYCPPKLTEFLKHSHPSPAKRISRLRAEG